MVGCLVFHLNNKTEVDFLSSTHLNKCRIFILFSWLGLCFIYNSQWCKCRTKALITDNHHREMIECTCISQKPLTIGFFTKGTHRIGNNGNIGLRVFTMWKPKIANKILPKVSIELWTFAIPAWSSSNWANQACASNGIFKLSFVHAPCFGHALVQSSLKVIFLSMIVFFCFYVVKATHANISNFV